MILARKLLSPEDGDGSDLGGADDSKPDPMSKLTEQVTALHETIGKLAQGYGSLDAALKAMDEKVTTLESSGGSRHGSSDDKSSSVDFGGDVDLETLSRKELVALMASSVGKIVQDHLKPIQEKMGKAFDRMDQSEALQEVREIKASEKDFLDFKEEIGGVLRDNPGLSIRRALQIARAENPEKAEKLRTKYNPRKPESDFTGGFFPTSSRTESSTKMKPQQAAEAAWQSVMSSLGDGAEKALNH